MEAVIRVIEICGIFVGIAIVFKNVGEIVFGKTEEEAEQILRDRLNEVYGDIPITKKDD